ncbi:MAG: hypothetical protein Q9162_003309 [Coniocarpon cinnabarinum]
MPIKEIRVHFGASSSRQNDERHRRLARAYDGFQSRSSETLANTRLLQEERDRGGGKDMGEASKEKGGGAATNMRQLGNKISEQERDCGSLERESASEGQLVNLTNLRFTASTNEPESLKEQTNAQESHPSESQPRPELTTVRSADLKRGRSPPAPAQTPPSNDHAPHSPARPSKRVRIAYKRRSDVYLDDTLEAAAVISSQLWNESSMDTQESEINMLQEQHDNPDEEQLSESHEIALPDYSVNDEPTSPSDVQPSSGAAPASASPEPTSAAAELEDTSLHASAEALVEQPHQSSENAPARSTAAQSSANAAPSSHSDSECTHPQYGTFIHLSMLDCPLPPTGNNSFDDFDFLTPDLQSLASDHVPITEKYDPYAITYREVKKGERGHWRFIIDGTDLHEDPDRPDTDEKGGILDAFEPGCFWNQLHPFVTSARAGDRVNCGCESWSKTVDVPVTVSQPDNTDTGGNAAARTGAQGASTTEQRQQITKYFAVFCMGQVIPHIYILLYWASASRIRFVDAEWVDKDNKVVVRVPRYY